MKTKLAVIIGLILAVLVLPPVPRSKTRASRIHSVNTVSSAAVVLPITNAPPSHPEEK